MAKAGRPKKEINWEEFDKLCHLHATQEEIAGWFECSVDTIDRAVKREKEINFAEYYAQKAANGKISLRRKQWQLALAGDKTMLIWLGKQHLKQAEKQELTGADGAPLSPQPAYTDEQADRIAQRIIERRLKGSS